MSGADRIYIIFIVVLVVAVGAGLYSLEQRLPLNSQGPVELSAPVDPLPSGAIVVTVEDTLPRSGLYEFPGDTTLGALIDTIDSGDGGDLEVVIRTADSCGLGPQRIDLNQADGWLFEALPGIGEHRAAAIIEYRIQHGGFRSSEELLFVTGIGPATYAQVRDLVTVSPVASDVASRH